MGTKETIAPSKSDKSSSLVQEQPSVHPYPDWSSMQAYYGPGVPIPAPYFGATVSPCHTHHPYLWSPQPMLTPFGGPYTAIYPHGGVYSHSSAAHMFSPVNPEVPSRPSNSIERGTAKKVNGLALSTGNGNDESADCNDDQVSESGDNEAGSSEGSDGKSESGANKKRRSRSSNDIPNTGGKKFDRSASAVNGVAKDAPPTISLQMTTTPGTVIGKPLRPVPLASLTPRKDLRSSNDSRLKHGVELILPTTRMDEREMKREKRKQSNRESARRSRLRKQAETEELAIKVRTLTAENNTIKSDITRLTESSDELRFDNSLLMEKLKMAQLRQEEERIDRIDNEDGPSIVIENLLSRIDNSSPASGSNHMEDEPHDNSSGKLHLLLDSNPRTDAVAAS